MKPAKNLIISFVLILFFSLSFFFFSYHNKRQSDLVDKWVIHTYLVIKEITELNIMITEFEAQDQDFVITDNKDFRKNLPSNRIKGVLKFNSIKRLTADNAAQQHNLEILNAILQKKKIYVDNVFDVLKTSRQNALLLLAQPESKKLYSDIKNALATMLGAENILLKQRTAEYEKALQTRFIYSVAFAIIGVILFVTAFWRIYRESISRNIAKEKAKRSEAKYKGLIEKSALIIYTTNLQGFFTYISDKGLEIIKYKREELIGKHYDILIPDNQKNKFADFYINQYKSFTKDLVEDFEIKTKDGEIKVIQLNVVLIEENNKIVGFQNIGRDITQFKYVESLVNESKIKLQQQQEEYNFRLQSVLNNIPMIFYIKDLKGRYLMANKIFTESFGLNADTIIGKKNAEVPQLSEKADFYDSVAERVKNTCRPIEFEEVLNTIQGDRNFLVTKFPLFDKNNEIFAISTVAKDITDMTFYMQQLIDARLKAEKAEQLQEAFLANMSHEIRTPMNGIVGMTNMILDTKLDSEQKEYAELIKRSSDVLLVLINDILDLSKIKAGRMELEAIDFNIREAIQNVLQPFKMNLKKNITLNYAVNDSVPDFVNGDSHKLLQILNNLLSNAAKFTAAGEIKLSANVIERNDGKIWIKFDISDTGIGISSSHIENIFENFTQAGNDTVRKFGGTGLGLAITKRLIELQKGTIQVESVQGTGTVFHIEIPYLPAAAKNTVIPQTNISDNNFKSGEIENKKILIVEDNTVNQRVLTSVLKKLKATWDIANNGKEAVDILETGNVYDLIIMDLQMPVMDGFETAEYIRTKLQINTPIIAMTASTLRNEKVKCFSVGMNGYLAKPFSPAELIRHMHNLINPVDIKEKIMEYKQTENEKLFDLAYLNELDDNDYLIEMLELFFETTSEMLEELQQSVKSKNWNAVHQGAHKLKSSLGPLQITKMTSIASAMEENARYQTNVDEIAGLNKDLNNQYALVKPMIEAELAKAKKISNGFVVSEMV